MGVTGPVAKQRVESLSEAEVHALAQRIDTLLAGGSLSNTDRPAGGPARPGQPGLP